MLQRQHSIKGFTQMIERILYDYLRSTFEGSGVGVYMQIPDPDTVPTLEDQAPFILIEKTGSSMENWICESTVAIQSYAGTLYKAAELNARVIDAMFGAVALDEITRVDLNSDYNFTDPETKRPRYQAVFDLTHYYTN